jgi:hypothetical protein
VKEARVISIFLAHRACGTPPGFRANLARLRLLEAGLRSTVPRLCPIRALGRTPEDDPASDGIPSAECLQALARRLIQGDGRLAGGPQATSCCPRADALWVVSPIDQVVEEQVAWAEEAGVPVQLIDAAEQEAQVLLGGLLLHKAETPLDVPPVVERTVFRHPEEVVAAYWGGAAELLGARALPVDQVRVQGGTNSAGFRARAEQVGLRLAAAAGVMRAVRLLPGWSARQERVFELRGRDQLPFEAVATVTGYSDASGAWRCWQWILSEIAAVLRGRRREAA